MAIPGAIPAPGDPLPRVTDAVRQLFQNGASQTALDALGSGVVGGGLFAVNRNEVDQAGGTPNAYNKIQFTTELSDTAGYFDSATNYRFQPTVAGLYLIFLSVNTVVGTSGETNQAEIRMNGATAVARSSYASTSSSSDWTSQVSNVVSLNGSTDYIEGFVYLPDSITGIKGFVRTTFMWGMRLA